MDDEKAVGSTILLLTHPSKPDQSKKVEAYTFLTRFDFKIPLYLTIILYIAC